MCQEVLHQEALKDNKQLLILTHGTTSTGHRVSSCLFLTSQEVKTPS